MTDSRETQTDVSRRVALDTGTIRRRAPGAQTGDGADLNSEAYLDHVEEEWNKRVDADVEILVDGMVDLVSLASIGDKDKFRVAQEAFQAQCRAESMVRAAHSLLSTAHSMKLLLLLSDEAQIVNRRDAELESIHADTAETKTKVAKLLDELLGKRDAE